MSQSTPAATHAARPLAAPVPRLSVGSVLPWLVLAALLFAVAFYFLSTEQGATSLFGGTLLHEWVHDGRHLLGFPCH
jgi:Probable cobalt transporter subunit (CbtB)